MKKIFSNITMLAALFVAGAAFTACSNESDDIAPIEQPAVNGQQVYTMTIQAGKSSDAITRALELDGSKLVAKWADGDQVTVLKGTTLLGTLTASDVISEGKGCTLSGTLKGEIAAADKLTLAYHLMGTSLSDIQTAVSAQTGTLESAAALDCATATVTVASVSGGAITISESSATFSGQTSVLKITMKDASSTAINAKSLTVALTYLTYPLGAFTFSSLDPTDGVVYLTLPSQAIVAQALALASSGKTDVATAAAMLSAANITFTASDGSSCTYTANKTGYTFAAAKYYGTTLTMTRTVNLTALSGAFTALDGDVLTGSTGQTITIADGATVTLNNASTAGGIVCAGTANIVLVGENSSTGLEYYAGIQVAGSGTTLTISGTGSLTAQGGELGAGIGSGAANHMEADITISGGTVTATGGFGGAGIGSGHYGDKTGAITISGGTINANGGYGGDEGAGAGIGGGTYGHCGGTITIANTVTKVTATKGSCDDESYNDETYSIGAGYACSITGTITIGDVVTGGIKTSPYTYQP